MTLEFDYVTDINTKRCREWHGANWPKEDPWNLADWSNAMLGEAGEAANIVKKLRRLDNSNTVSKIQIEQVLLTEKLGKELADTFLYLDLLATRAGIYLPKAIVKKFNYISERENLPQRMEFR